MKRFALAVCAAGMAFAQDDSDALSILQDLEALGTPVEQENVLGKMDQTNFAQLRFLDRLNAEVKDVILATGQSAKDQYITVSMKACYVPRDKSVNDAVAYLVIEDEREFVPVFEGWMVASSPALSAMDHARYDVWVVNCTNRAPKALSGTVDIPPTRPQ